MQRGFSLRGAVRFATLLPAAAMLLFPKISIAGETKGTLAHPKGTVLLKHSYLVQGPDALDAKKKIRRVVFSADDLGAKLQACKTMDCVDGEITEGMTVDFDTGPRLNYWMAIHGARLQYSGTLEPAALKTTENGPKRIAGKLAFDDGPSGGPKVDVDFDAALVKEFTQAR